jgi:hypothetical protein
MGIFIKVNGDISLDSGDQFFLQIFNKFCYPAIVSIIVLAVTNENIVFVIW